ncbi:hypothetical protein BpHYR1_043199, partial [Brachionus plicatilis]
LSRCHRRADVTYALIVKLCLTYNSFKFRITNIYTTNIAQKIFENIRSLARTFEKKKFKSGFIWTELDERPEMFGMYGNISEQKFETITRQKKSFDQLNLLNFQNYQGKDNHEEEELSNHNYATNGPTNFRKQNKKTIVPKFQKKFGKFFWLNLVYNNEMHTGCILCKRGLQYRGHFYNTVGCLI